MANNLLLLVLIRASDQASMVMSKLGLTTATTFGGIMLGAAGVLAAIGAIGGVSVVMAAQFDQSMHRISALTTTSQAQMQQYETALLQMAPALDQTPKALADGLYFVISAGYSGAQALDILTQAAKASAATFTPMMSVADLLTTAMNAYRGANVSAGHAMDDLIKVVVNGKVTMQSLATSMGFVLVTAHAAGLSIDEASAAVSALSQIAGEHGARRVMMGLDNLLRAMEIKAVDLGNAMHKAGIGFDVAKYSTMPFIEKLQYLAQVTGLNLTTLQQLKEKAHGNEAVFEQLALTMEKGNAKFMKYTGGAAAFIPALMLLANHGQAYNAILKQMGGNGEATARAFDDMRKSTGQQWAMFERTLESIATTLGLQLLPYVNMLLTGFTRAFRVVLQWLGTEQGMETFKYVLGAIAVVAGGALVAALVSLNTAALPIIGAIAAIIVAGTEWGVGVHMLVQSMGGMQNILKALAPVIQFLQGLFRQAHTEILKAFADPSIHQALQQLQQALPQLIPLLQIIGFILLAVVVVAFELSMAVLRGLISMLPGLILLFAGVINVLGGLARIIVDIFTGNWKDILPALKQVGIGLVQIIGGALFAVLGLLYGFVEHFIQLFGFSDAQIAAAWNAFWHGLIATIVSWWNGASSAITGALGKARTTVQGWGTGLVTWLKGVGAAILAAITWPFRMVAEAGKWLYQHNYYVQAFVDHFRLGLARLRTIVVVAIAFVRAWIQQQLTTIGNDAKAAWALYVKYVETPLRSLILKAAAILLQIRATILGWLTKMWQDAQGMWAKYVALVTSLRTKLLNAIQQYVINPIEQPMLQMVKRAEQWGENLMKMLAKGIQNAAGKVGDAAKGALSQVAGWLGFHSPAPKVPDSARWGANLLTMFASSMLTAVPALQRAGAQAMNSLSGSLALGAAGGAGAAGAGASGGAIRGGGAGAAGGGGGVTHIHNWAGAFPGVKSSDEIVKAIRKVQQDDYRAGRRPGGFGGLRAGGVDTLVQ